MKSDFSTISHAELDDVTGGGAIGNAWNWAKKNAGGIAETVGGLFGGEGMAGYGTSVGVQNGANQRSAQGNTGPVSMGDGSPINAAGQ
jgi:hypothetical protein